MNSDLPKVIHPIGDRPMVSYVIETVRAVDAERVLLVIGYQAERVREVCAGEGVEFVVQEEQLGTGHAVQQCEPSLDGFDGTVLVLNGDVPCLRPDTLSEFIGIHNDSGAAATVLTARMEDPSGYGRIVRDDDGALNRIVEHSDADADVLRIDEINSGLFCFGARALFSALGRTDRDNAQNEYYLTDVVAAMRASGLSVGAHCVRDNREVAGVNNVDELESVRRYFEGAL